MEGKTPFSGRLIEYGNLRKPHIRAIEGVQGMVVRSQRIDRLNMDRQLEIHNNGMKEFQRMKDTYGFSIPDYQEVVGEDGCGETTLFTLVEEVQGDTLKEVHDLETEDIVIIESFYLKMINYYSDVLKTKGMRYWPEFSDDQVVFGKATTSKEKDVYIIDLDPIFLTSPLENDTYHEPDSGFDSHIEELYKSIVNFEERLGVILNNARSKLVFLLNEALMLENLDSDILRPIKLDLEKHI